MISDKKNIQQLCSLLLQKGIHDVIISPGSRNAPLINTFFGETQFHCLNIVDERSATYFALGVAQAKKKPVAVVSTSGTSVLNYGPAIAEAFYQKIPLVVLTADRPRRWVDHADGQTIRQENVFSNHVIKSINLLESESKDDIYLNNLMINEALNLVLSENKGPIHINIPLDEPLYNTLEAALPFYRNIEISGKNTCSEIVSGTFLNKWEKSSRTMIIVGQHGPDDEMTDVLKQMVDDFGVAVIAEHICNQQSSKFIQVVDPTIAAISKNRVEEFRPDLLITFGGQIVSKRMKLFLRENKPSDHWHISCSGEQVDTYNSLTGAVKSNPLDFLKTLIRSKKGKGDFATTWKDLEIKTTHLQQKFLDHAAFSDLIVARGIINHIPEHSVVHLGNSSAIRIMQMFEPVHDCLYLGNRGTSGIDGSLSTASGFAFFSKKINTVFVGDLAFFYDSNALWNRYLSDNLRIIVLNNEGGNIFRLIGGPGKSKALNEHFVAVHNLKAEGLAKAFDINYLFAENIIQLNNALTEIYQPDYKGPVILEVKTNGETSAEVFRDCFIQLKNM